MMNEQSQDLHEIAFHGYDQSTPRDTVLLVPEPYTNVYIYWLLSQIDLGNAEINKYNNDSAMFKAAWNEYSDHYTAEHMPRQHTGGFGF